MPSFINPLAVEGTMALKVEGLDAGYGVRQVLDGVSFSVGSGELVAIIGHNAAGKSTLLKTIFGLMDPWRGSVEFPEASVDGGVRGRLSAGISYSPQGGRVFGTLSVWDNIRLAAIASGLSHESGDIEGILREFPTLLAASDRDAGMLSGGQKQLLMLASSLVMAPQMLLLDEPCFGLSLTRASEVIERLVSLRDESKVTTIVVEHKVRRLLAVADRVVVLRRGRVSFFGLPSELEDTDRLREVYA